ncbi:hypothetical protein BKA66DRAFT_71781 [Pyrenochaeta sp. MPI-SDFR-AT-0127]|nr:hypothetical protein BKA66DRAFT_71781 [Pyrenochaeta sp. MPI-SDFR-AT-0127]
MATKDVQARCDGWQKTPAYMHMVLAGKGAVASVCEVVRKQGMAVDGEGGRGSCVKYLLILPSNWTLGVGIVPVEGRRGTRDGGPMLESSVGLELQVMGRGKEGGEVVVVWSVVGPMSSKTRKRAKQTSAQSAEIPQ